MPARPRLRTALVGSLTALAVLAPAVPAQAVSPYGGPAGGDPYAYQDYMRLPTYTPPTEFGADGSGGNAWKYSSKSACALYGDANLQKCTPRTRLNEQDPQELFNVTGASVDRSWEVSTGRPDVVIGVVDSGIEWDDVGAMRDLNNKTYLNVGELPEPDWGVRDAAHPYDRDRNGQVDVRDWCPSWEDENDCGGSGDPRVRGAAGNDDTDLNRNGLIDPEDLIFLFSDGVDDDANGYVDDIAGWDTYEDDNDPYDDHSYGHGTGEARDSTAEANNGGDVGTCPDCRVMHLRVGDSFIADVNDFAQAVLFATDTGATLIQSALGTLNNSRFAQEAIDYAYRRGVLLIASAADESAGHHNQPSMLEHATVFNAIGEPQTQGGPSASGSYLQFRGCTNYGAYMTAAVPGNSCSSEAVGRAAGMAGVTYAAGRNAVAKGALADYGVLDGPGGVPAGHALSAEEVKQLIATTADDINNLTPVNKEKDVDFPGISERYPAGAGWDPFFGYGRINANDMARSVQAGIVPPEADISSPTWYQTLPTTAPIRVQGAVAARRAAAYDVKVEWAPWSWRDANAAPTYSTAGVTLRKPGGTTPFSGLLAEIDPAVVKAALDAADTSAPGLGKGTRGPAVDPVTGRGDKENRNLPDKFGVILRLTVTAKDAAGAPLQRHGGGPLTGIATKNMNLHDDPALVAGFPKDLQGDGAAAPRFADLDDDGKDELVVATSNGEVHAYRADGSELPGWPVLTTPLPGSYTGSAAYRSGEITQPGGAVRSATLRSPAIGDLDRDGHLEVVVPDFAGRITAFDRFGRVLPGFPVRTNPAFSAPQPADRAAGFYRNNPAAVPGRYPRTGEPLPNDPDLVPDLVNRRTKLNRTHWWVMAAPTLGDIDPSRPGLEIVVGAADRHVYAWHADGSPVAGWPVMLRDPSMVASVHPFTREITQPDGVPAKNGAKIVTSPALGDIDGDGDLDVVAAPNEQYEEAPNSDDPVFTASGAVLTPGNQRLYALHRTGATAGTGPGSPANGHPNANAYLPGWPTKLSTATLELLPVVGNGPTGSPVIGDVVPGGGLEVAAFGTVGPVHVVNGAGESVYGQSPDGRDRTLLTEGVGSGANSKDSPSIPAVGGSILTDLDADGALDVAVPAAGLGKLLDLALPDDQLLSDNHLAVYNASPDAARKQLEAFPREVNDLQFLSTPASFDVDGDGLEEVLTGTAYSDLHAFNALGLEPGQKTLDDRGWPKFTGGWTVVTPATGSFTGTGTREVASTTREGDLFVWTTTAEACDLASWREAGHDGWNSGNSRLDAIRPARVSDLRVTAASVAFTAVGDDGRCGRATAYDVRASSQPITAANFASATPVSGAPAPKPAGEAESFAVTLPEGTRYVAVRVLDGNPAAATPLQPVNPSALAVAPLPGVEPSPSPTGSASPTASPTPTPTASPTGSASPTPSPTASGQPTASPGSPTSPGTDAPAGSRFHRLNPARVLDTREQGAPVAAGSDRVVNLSGKGGVPSSGVRAVVLNVTVTGVENNLDLQVYPWGARPARRTSNLNAVRGQTVANLVTTAVGADGSIALSVSQGATHVVLDVLGWYGEGSSGDGYVPQVPNRRFDSRESTPVRAGADRVVPLFGSAPPAGVSSAVVSVTALGTPGNADVQLYAAGSPPSRRTSTLNLRRGETVANLAVVPVDSQGRVAVSVSQASVHVVLDLVGYYGSASSRLHEALTPARTYDTRENGTRLRAGSDREVQVTGLGGVPTEGVEAVLVNVTSVGSDASADLQVYPAGERPARRTSNLNVRRGQTVPVLVMVKVGRDGRIALSTSQGSMHVVLDVMGYVRSVP